MFSSSFKKDAGSPPLRYRTPSPPLHDLEPLSPVLDVASIRYEDSINSHGNISGSSSSQITDGRKNGVQKGTYQVVGMDDFDPTPLASTSSQRLRRDRSLNGRRVQQKMFEDHNSSERPAKRARNEKISMNDSRRTTSRPITDNTHVSEIRRLEAELLLNFSREACFSVPPLQVSSRQAQDTTQMHRSFKITHLRPHVQNAEVEHHEANRLSPASSQLSSPKSRSVDQRLEILANTLSENIGNGGAPESSTYTLLHTDFETNDTVLDAMIKNRCKASAGKVRAESSPTSDELQIFSSGKDDAVGSVMASEKNDGQCENKPTLIVHSISTPNGTSSEFLEGFEEATRPLLGEESQTPELPPTIDKQALDNPTDALPNQLAKNQGDAPSICAACNFSRNSLTLETENDATSWISCDACKSWFHFACAGFKSEREVRAVDKYRCRKCKPIHGPTTYVRKSARAHSAIDYAGLNEGVLKTSDENPEHHYIKPIKDGVIKFNPENFARMRPELVTAEYFERGDGMKEPIVIPSSLNPRPRSIPNPEPNAEKNENDEFESTAAIDELHDQSVLDQWLSHDFEYQTVPDHGQDALDMVIPQDLTVRKVAELYGPEEKVEVIDVKSQNGEDKKWNMRRWVDYYESKGNKVVRNVISLEVSQSKLGRLIRRPKVVRDLDLQDSVWPADLIVKGDYPKVQFYCLMSVADCFTDFHIDFGGSSVFYHILKGKKTFFFIPPHEKHLKKYEEWCMSPAQNWTFLGDQTKECYRVDLSEGDTMLIPAGWIHAVWTPEDSLVIGGNFLTRMNYQMQIRVAQIEKATGVARKFRYPQFQKLLWLTAIRYLEDDPIPDGIAESLLAGQNFDREQPTYLEFYAWGDASTPGPENYHARYYSKAELDGLPELGRYLQRTALIAMGNITEGISVETRNAVKRSIPKGYVAEPLEFVKKFAIWYTWKRGNEPIPHWAYPDHVPEGGAPELGEKKLSAAALRRLDREAALQAWRVAPDRQSARRSNTLHHNAETASLSITEGQDGMDSRSASNSKAPSIMMSGSVKRKTSNRDSEDACGGSPTTPAKKRRPAINGSLSNPRRPACEICRKRRRACKHRDEIKPQLFAPGFPELADGSITVSSTANGGASSSINGSSLKTVQQLNDAAIGTWQAASLAEENKPSDAERGPLHMLHVEIIRSNPSTDLQRESRAAQNLSNTTPVKLAGAFTTPSSKPSDVQYNSASRAPGRTRACTDCRRSKRRCVHDENGNEDPAKLAEASVPRLSVGSKKRRVSGNETEKSSAKKTKKIPKSLPTINHSISLREEPLKKGSLPVVPIAEQALTVKEDSAKHSEESAICRPTNHTAAISTTTDVIHVSSVPTASMVRDQVSTEVEEDEVHLITTSPLSELKYEPDMDDMLSQNHIFLQPAASSLVSPPASTHTDAESTPPAPSKSEITPVQTSSSSRQSSSHPAKKTQRYTPESGPARRASCGSVRVSSGRESGSPAMSVFGKGTGQRLSKSRMNSEVEADPESLRLIRELQAQDLGLRRRTRE